MNDELKKLQDPLYYIPKFLKVLTKADDSGMSHLIPMELWPSQRYYIENRGNRNICLKNRQVGFSSGVMADNSTRLFTSKYQRQTIVANDDETAIWLFQTIQRFHRNLPADIRPKTDWKSGQRMRFPNLDSFIYVDSAQSDTLGIGHTLNCAHLSEVGRWPPKKADQLFADITQTVPKGGIITLESTPNGRAGLFYRLYQAAKNGDIDYKCIFLPWWWDVTCLRDAPRKLDYTLEEEQLIRHFKLTPEQIAFRREKIAEIGDLFYQEYPENDTDCWLSMEQGCFDGIAIRRYLKDCHEGNQDSFLTTWKGPMGGEKYVIGVDVAAGKERGDFSVASVLSVKRNEYVARVRGRIDPDIFSREVIRLGARYNDAEIGVERAGHGHTVLKILLENEYPNLYIYRDYDSLRYGSEPGAGWVTSAKSKPIMVDTLAIALRANDLGLWSENLMNECSGMYWDGAKVKTAAGGYDDEADAVMIALQLRENAPIVSEGSGRPMSYVSL